MGRILILLCICFSSYGQTHKFFIRFSDKSQSPFNITMPEQFLSQRAIDRRIKQSILITEQDLPVDPAFVNGVTSLGAAVFSTSKWFNGATVECDSNILSQIMQLPYVISASQVFRQSAPKSENKFSRLGAPFQQESILAANYNYGQAYNQIHLMHGEYLHSLGASGEGMLIAVLDAGFFRVDQHAALHRLGDR